MKDSELELAAVAMRPIAAKMERTMAAIANPSGTRRKQRKAKERRKQAKESRRRNRK